MFGYEEFDISFAFNPGYLLLAFILIAGYTFFTYKYTVPPTGKFKKIILIILRTASLLLLVIIIFEPILNLARKEIITPLNLVFIDNSRSMTINDGTGREEKTREIAGALSAVTNLNNTKYYVFGNDVSEVSADSINGIKFTEGATNISGIFNSIDKNEIDAASVTLITDGVFNAGGNPYYDAIEGNIPVFCVGIGDTALRKDVGIKKVNFNEFNYAETPTTIAATIQNTGFAGQEATVSFFEGDNFISSQKIKLSGAGIQNVSFDYTPAVSGEKKLSVIVTSLKEEFTTANNKKIFYINVLSNKIRVLLVASGPSPDLSLIKNTLSDDKNLNVKSITQISENRFLENFKGSLPDSVEILFLIGVPSKDTPEDLWLQVQELIKTKKVPYFLTVSTNTSLDRLTNLQSELSFSTSQLLPGYKQVQPEIIPGNNNHPIIQHNSGGASESWNQLPPVLQLNTIFLPKPESKVLANTKINNTPVNYPLLLIRNFSGRKSVTVLAQDIWRWKLQTATKKSNLFDSFILNSVRWLNAAEEQRRVEIKTSKRNYSQGENIEFSAQVYDESLNPVSDAGIKINIHSDDNFYETDLQSLGTGLYEGKISINETGDFKFTSEAFIDGTSLGKDEGSFNIGEIDLEMIEPVMNYNLLRLISNETGGELYFPENYEDLFKKLEEISRFSAKDKFIRSEIKLWSDEWLLIIAIILLSLEWFLRKRTGLL